MRYYTYNIPLHPSALRLPERRGLILETEQGWGEAAPLENCIDAFVFALRSAQQPFPKHYPNIRINALASTLEEAELALQRGFQTIKYKVRGLSPETATKTVSVLQTMGVPLRIDANRSWSFEEAKRFLTLLDPKGIEYIEEPVDDPTRLHELPSFPFALDETLLDPAAPWQSASAFVLKPTVLGDRLQSWIDLGKKEGKTLTFGSSFESAIGLVHIARLQGIHSPDTPAGLDTYRSFKHNFLPFPIERGMLLPEPIPPVDRSWLTNVAL